MFMVFSSKAITITITGFWNCAIAISNITRPIAITITPISINCNPCLQEPRPET